MQMATKNRIFISLLLLAVFAGSAYAAACISYDRDCSGSPGGCCSGLTCQTFTRPGGSTVKKCSQASLCTNQPEAWVNPSLGAGAAANASGPYNATMDLEQGSGLVNQTSTIYRVGWFSDWKTSSLIGVMIAIIIIAIAALIGHSFNLPEMKAFVDSELMQAVVSALLVMGIMALIIFFDGIARLAIEAGNLPVVCNPDEPCYLSTAKQYLDNVYSVGRDYARESLKESFNNQQVATRGISMQWNVWWAAFAGSNTRLNAGYSIKAERGGAIFETVSKLLTSIYAQKYFIEVVSFGIAPIFLLFGILLRTFIFTRKLGGLLLAIAISLFVVYPLTFAFAWYTLNVTVYGERALSVTDPACPSECTLTYPVAFYVNPAGSITQFRTTQEILRAGLNSSNWASGEVKNKNGVTVATYPGLVACKDLSTIGIGSSASADSGTGNYESQVIRDPGKNWRLNQWLGSKASVGGRSYTIVGNDNSSLTLSGISGPQANSVPYSIIVNNDGGCGQCPDYCREVPFPATLPGCNIASCASCNAGCKVMRQRYDCADKCTSACNDDCITGQPTENKCYYNSTGQPQPANLGATCEGCDGCPTWCKIVYEMANGTRELANKDQAPCQVAACKPSSLGGSCPDSCLYTTKLGSGTNKCDDLCTYQGVTCPRYCRVTNSAEVNATYDISSNRSIMTGCMTGAQGLACAQCPNGCKVDIVGKDIGTYLNSCAPFPRTSNAPLQCTACPDYCRLGSFANYSDAGSFTPLEYNYTVAGGIVPKSCSKTALFGLNCASPASCDGSCKSPAYPSLCLDYDSGATIQNYCLKCPLEARNTLVHTSATGATDYSGVPSLSSSVSCSSTQCNSMCRNSAPLVVPTQASEPTCKDYNATSQTCHTGYTTQNVCGCYEGIIAAGAAQGGARFSAYAGKETPAGPNIPLAPSCSPPCDSQHWCRTGDNTCVACAETCSAGEYCTSSGCVPAHSCPSGQHYECRDIQVPQTICDPDYNSCQRCPISCRVSFSNPAWLDSAACTQTACTTNCDTACKAQATSNFQLCKAYLGNGGEDVSLAKIDDRAAPYNERDSCKQCPENCRIRYWNSATSSYDYYQGDCGLKVSNSNPTTSEYNMYVDCSTASCPGACRVDVPKPSDTIGICKSLKLTEKPCVGCNALCRRTINAYPPMPPQCSPACGADEYCDVSGATPACSPYPGGGGTCSPACGTSEFCDGNPSSPTYNTCLPKSVSSTGDCPDAYCGAFNTLTGLGCTEMCKLPDPPVTMCDSCVECPTDCLYKPATRTDCSEVCTEEALAGPLNVGPSDFVKKLPGAQGESDVKNVGVLMIPALVLPLFCIVIVIAFIRILSPILGGDMEIPGIGKII